MNPEWDVVVVGTGPAGATAARWAAKKGLRTLLIDKAKLPRDKPCGGGVATKALDRLGLELPEDLVAGRVKQILFHVDDHTVSTNPGDFGITTWRSRFDHYLVKQAVAEGAVLKEGQEVITGEASGKEGGRSSSSNLRRGMMFMRR